MTDPGRSEEWRPKLDRKESCGFLKMQILEMVELGIGRRKVNKQTKKKWM